MTRLDTHQSGGNSASSDFGGTQLAERTMVVRGARIGIVLLTAALMTAAAPAVSQAQPVTGTVQVSIFRAGFIIGVGGGHGTLNFLGEVYPFSVGGVGVGMIGAAGANLQGQALNLAKPTDIVGTYTAVGASAAIGAGVRGTKLQNANGVILELQGGEIGLELSLNLGGMTITMP